MAATAVATTEEEIDRLAGAHDDGPGPPKWLRADRVERAGAPLSRLIDFRAEVPADARSWLEAGLEAAGLPEQPAATRPWLSRGWATRSGLRRK